MAQASNHTFVNTRIRPLGHVTYIITIMGMMPYMGLAGCAANNHQLKTVLQ